jgi:hypothetical protein
MAIAIGIPEAICAQKMTIQLPDGPVFTWLLYLFYPFSFLAIFGRTVFPEASMLVKMINNFIPSNQDQGLGGSHHHCCYYPKEIE